VRRDSKEKGRTRKQENNSALRREVKTLTLPKSDCRSRSRTHEKNLKDCKAETLTPRRRRPR